MFRASRTARHACTTRYVRRDSSGTAELAPIKAAPRRPSSQGPWGPRERVTRPVIARTVCGISFIVGDAEKLLGSQSGHLLP